MKKAILNFTLFGFITFLSLNLIAQTKRYVLSEGSAFYRQEQPSFSWEPNLFKGYGPRFNIKTKDHPEYGLYTTKYGGIELIQERDAFSKVFINEDGTYGRVQGQLPIHFKDENGNWLTYDDRLIQLPSGDFGLRSTDIPVYVDPNRGTSFMNFDNQGSKLTFSSNFSMSYQFEDQSAQKVRGNHQNNFIALPQDQTVVWKNAWTNIDRIQKLSQYDLETDYLIQQRPEFGSSTPQTMLFTEHIQLPRGWKVVFGEGEQAALGWIGSLMIIDAQGKTRGYFEQPVYYDSHEEKSKVSLIRGAYHFEQTGTQLTLSVVVDVDWLMNEHRKYPIVIDPIVSNALSGDRNVGPTSGSSASCEHTMNVNVPAGIISVVETTMPIEARNSGWMNEQRVNFGFNGVFSGDLGPFCNTASTGTCNLGILYFNYLVHPGGNIPAAIQPWKTWASTDQDACNQYNQRVRSNWTVYVGYAVQTGNEIVFDWMGNVEQLYVVPDGYCQAEIEVWGAGGGGGGALRQVFYSSSPRAAGGGGGAYSRVTVSIEEDDELIVFVGSGGLGGVGAQDGLAGQESYVERNLTTIASAAGGQGGRFRRGDNSTGSATGAGGNSGVGFLFAGGNGGGTASSGDSGGGGGAGGSTAAGTNGTNSAAGIGGAVGGGDGGAPKTSNNQNGDPGVTPGGGASGARRTNSNGSNTGGLGGDGRVIIRLTPNPADGSISATSPTIVCLGDAITVAPSGGEGTPKYWIQSPVGHPTWNIAENQAPNAAGNGYTFTPGAVGTYRVHARWENVCGFCWNIPGHDWATNNKCPDFAFVDFEVVAPSSAPSSIDVVGLPVCHGGEVTLSVVGGSLSSGAQWEWFAGSCASSVIDNGASIDVAPSTTTDYFVRASSGSGCPASVCATVEVELPATSTNLSVNNDNATCVVNTNDWVHFYNNAGRLIASINAAGQDLGEVTARTFVNGSTYVVPSCTEPSNQSFWNAALARTFVISPDVQPTNPVTVRLYILDSEFADYQSTASGTASNTHDDAANLAALNMTKVSGGNDDGDPMNNCGVGTHEFVYQSNSGDINSLSHFSGFSASSYLEFTISGFSQFFPMNSDNSALPVSLTQFSANCLGEKIQISWSTASESNASHYILQTSRDGQTWLHVAEIEAAGTTNQTSNYSYEDINFGALTYYRLVQVDNDGTQEIFGPISSNCTLKNNLMTVHPNPTTENFMVTLQSVQTIENTTIELVDMSGRVIQSQHVDIHAGSTMLNFDVKAIQPGAYIIRVLGENDKFAPMRVVKM